MFADKKMAMHRESLGRYNVTMPPEEQVFQTMTAEVHVASTAKSELRYSQKMLGEPGTDAESIRHANFTFNIPPSTLIPRRLKATYQLVVEFTSQETMMGFQGMPYAAIPAEEKLISIRDMDQLFTVNANPLGSILRTVTLHVDGKPIRDDPWPRWVVDQTRMSQDTRQNKADQANNGIGYDIHTTLFGGRPDSYVHGQWVPRVAEPTPCYSTEGILKAVFDIVEYIPCGGLFVDYASSTHVAAVSGIEKLEFKVKAGQKTSDMLHVLQPGIVRDNDGIFSTMTDSQTNPDAIPQVYIRGMITFSIETIEPPRTLLGSPRTSLHGATAIQLRSFPIPIVKDDNKQAHYAYDGYTLNTATITVTTVPAALYIWVEDDGDKNNFMNPIGKGTSTYITKLKIGYATYEQQLFEINMDDLQTMTVENGGFRVAKWPYSPAAAANNSPDGYKAHSVPTPGQVYLISPTLNLNSNIVQTPGLYSTCNLTISTSFAMARPHMGKWPTAERLAVLQVALVNPGLIMAGDWNTQVGLVSVPDVQEAHIAVAREPSSAMIFRGSEAAPVPYHGHMTGLSGGGIGSFFSGLFHKAKALASHVWEKVKSDPIGTLETAISTGRALGMGNGGEGEGGSPKKGRFS